MARRGGLRGAGGISTASSIAANMARGFCPKKRSAAVVPSGRVRKNCARLSGTHVFSGDRALAAGDSSARDTRCALPHSNESAGTPLLAWLPLLEGGFAASRSTLPTAHRVQTAGYGGAPPAHAAPRPGARSGSRPRAQGNTTESDAHAWRRTAVMSTPIVGPAGAHTPRQTRWSPAFWAQHARLSRCDRSTPG